MLLICDRIFFPKLMFTHSMREVIAYNKLNFNKCIFLVPTIPLQKLKYPFFDYASLNSSIPYYIGIYYF